MISRRVFLTGIERLGVFFDCELSEVRCWAYYDKLKNEIDDIMFNRIVERIIEEDSRFPLMSSFWSRINPTEKDTAYMTDPAFNPALYE